MQELNKNNKYNNNYNNDFKIHERKQLREHIDKRQFEDAINIMNSNNFCNSSNSVKYVSIDNKLFI